MGDVAAAAMQQQELPKSSLMKKLSSLLLPKKSKSKSGSASQKPAAASLSQGSASTGSELELLFAQAEATLGELLVRAGASFEARPSSYSHTDQHLNARGNPNNADDLHVSALISSGSRSAKFSGAQAQGHARRRSLSRVWQQLGGSLFSCGSGHMSGYVMDHDMMPPAPSKGVYEDVVLDEAYWQSLADAMLLQQSHQQLQQPECGDAKLAAATANVGADDSQNELSWRGSKEVRNDDEQGVHYGDQYLQEETDRESEIVLSIDAAESMGIMKLWPVCGSSNGLMSLQDMDSMCYRNLVGVESGGGCTRMNTTLDESPNLAHNYHNMKVGGSTSSTSNCYSCPEANSCDEELPSSSMQPQPQPQPQPLERFLRQAARTSAAVVNEFSASSRSAPELFTLQEQPTGVELSGTSSGRVSLMTLLHEESAAADSTTTLEARREEEEEAEAAAAVALLDEEGWRESSMRSTMQVGEDPLLCCVCMIRRKGAALIPCGHTFCRTCAKQLFAGRGACPLCNNLIVQVLDIF